MAAYGSLVSVMNIIETIQNHPRPPISFDKEQLHSLTENITFLQQFLETHSVDDDGLEGRIADAAYAAEDVIESHIVDQIEANAHGDTISSVDFYDGLHKVIQDLDLIKRDTVSFTNKAGIKGDDADDDQLLNNDYSLRRSHSSVGQDTSVGLEDVSVEVMDKLTGHQSNLRIIPIVGMGGIGKTTLARNVYVNPFIEQYFDFRGWATISQEYKSKEILLEVLLCLEGGSLSHMSEDELGNKLYKSLFGRRYLIVLDDIWSIEAWHKVKTFFPDNNNGSRIMVTTRLSNLASQLGGSDGSLEMSFLDEDKSWNLFCKSTFGEESCPGEFEGIGKNIVENCKGLALSIVVVGGLLAKLKRTREYWLYIAGNLNSIVNSEDDERCLKILDLSYKELPVYLKPCFLYMGMYPEDWEIDVPELMRVWVAEGFLKPISGKCLEVVAQEYFNDLLGRNLILVNERGYSGETIKCKVHDLLVDVCVREAQKHKFFCLARHYNLNNPQNIKWSDTNTQRRIAVHEGTKPEVIRVLPSHGTLVRSLTLKFSNKVPASFKLLRVWNKVDERSPWDNKNFLTSTRGIVNCRYISRLYISSTNPSLPSLPSSIFSLWNLQTLNVRNLDAQVVTSEIWKMSQLRHVHFDELYLRDPPTSGSTNGDRGDDFVLRNLQTLSRVKNFKFSEEVIKRIPNIKELRVYYRKIWNWSSYCLNNLVQLINLESLDFKYSLVIEPIPSELLNFPRLLKHLTLSETKIKLRDLGTKIGSLPHLQVLNLEMDSVVGREWVTVEGHFRSLKYLDILGCDLEYWRTESWTHFPCLEHLRLRVLRHLEEIPSEIGETLKSIVMNKCRESAIISANEILKEQEDLGNQGLHVNVELDESNQVVESLSGPNFKPLRRPRLGVGIISGWSLIPLSRLRVLVAAASQPDRGLRECFSLGHDLLGTLSSIGVSPTWVGLSQEVLTRPVYVVLFEGSAS
ncbi:putative late blight resistance protein homolog r1a-6 [Phtheirospermum japonicum]|uniref:Putative late blight resistance protein homolog r1a-6 n=1 Tax=Phtheirospermum japonicum TaxID=374723 RepID=A0A830D2U1_9LAMI|nr:putative late blight resistance protein homolog r1a-6 [Phtheirospermum japonicum]